MKVFDSLKKKAEESKKVIVFPEGNDDRIIKAAVRLEKEGIVKPLLLGKPDEVIETAQSFFSKQNLRHICWVYFLW